MMRTQKRQIERVERIWTFVGNRLTNCSNCLPINSAICCQEVLAKDDRISPTCFDLLLGACLRFHLKRKLKFRAGRRLAAVNLESNWKSQPLDHALWLIPRVIEHAAENVRGFPQCWHIYYCSFICAAVLHRNRPMLCRLPQHSGSPLTGNQKADDVKRAS